MCDNLIDDESLFEEAKTLFAPKGEKLKRTGPSPQMNKEAAIRCIKECKDFDAFRASSMSRGFKKVVR